MILDPDPAALIGQAAAARVAELQQTLQRSAANTRQRSARCRPFPKTPSRTHWQPRRGDCSRKWRLPSNGWRTEPMGAASPASAASPRGVW